MCDNILFLPDMVQKYETLGNALKCKTIGLILIIKYDD